MRAFTFAGLVALSLLASLQAAFAEISTSGIVNPPDPTKWASDTEAMIGSGQDEDGSVTVNGGSALLSANAYLGNYMGERGTVTITGDGSTWTSSGNLYIGAYHYGIGKLTISDGGSVSCVDTYLGYMRGASGVVEIYSGSSWNLSGDLYVGYEGSGTVTQDAGSVSVGGTLTLGNGGNYYLNGGTLSMSGLSGSSGLSFAGGTLAAKNDFTTSLNATIAADKTAYIDSNGYTITWNGVLSGDGGLAKGGTGVLILSGTNTYTGGTTVSGGSLIVNGLIVGDLTVNSGSVGGTGTVGNLINNGTVSPGNSIGAFIVLGNYTQASGSTLVIETDAYGNCDDLSVSGTATINGGTVSVDTTGGYTTGTDYTFLTAGALDVVADADIVVDSAFLTAMLGYNDTSMWFTLSGSSHNYVDEAHTRNQYAVAYYLDAHKSGATGDFATVLDALNLQSGDGARAAFDAMSGEIYGSLATISIENNERFVRSVAQRMQRHSMMHGLDFACNDADPALVYVNRTTSSFDQLAERMCGWTTWFESYGVGGALAGNGNADGLGYSTGGLIVGMERALDECTLLGIAGGYANTDTTLQNRNDGADINSGQFGIYMQRLWDSNYLTAVAGYGYNNFDVGRSIEFGAIDRVATSNYGGNNYMTYFEVGRNIARRYVNWQPFAALEYIGVRQDGFMEDGADSVDLATQSLTANAFRSLLGARMSSFFRTKAGRLVAWNTSAMWRHEFLNDGRILDASFVGQTDTAFAVYGANVDRDAAIFDTGLNLALSERCSLYANYDLIFSRNYAVNAGQGGFQYTW